MDRMLPVTMVRGLVLVTRVGGDTSINNCGEVCAVRHAYLQPRVRQLPELLARRDLVHRDDDVSAPVHILWPGNLRGKQEIERG